MQFLKENKYSIVGLLDFLFGLIRFGLGLGVHKNDSKPEENEEV